MPGTPRVTVEGTERFKAKLRNMEAACSSNEAKEVGVAGGKVIERIAKATVHVITGNLRDSIRTEASSEEPGMADVIAGGINGVDYAADEEFGNSRRPAHPYLRPAADTGRSEARTVMRAKTYALLRKARQ